MKYRVTIDKRVLKSLEKINEPDYSKIKNALFALADNPRPPGCKKLKGRTGYRIRQGNYRIIYDIFDHILIVEVIAIGNRKDIYE
jgi:mRNA interferase RelE/StbE